MRIALLIRALDRGGAERQLVTLADGLSAKGHDVHVLTFHDNGALVPELQATGAVVRPVKKQGRWDVAGFLVRLVRELRSIAPDVVYSSMPAANVASALTRSLVRGPAVVWRLASSEMDLAEYHWFSALSYKVEAMLASTPELIVANAISGREAAVRRGYPADHVKVIANGIQTGLFVPREQSGKAVRHAWGLDESKWTIGQVARSDPKKGYEDFLSAAKILRGIRTDVQFLCIGVDSGEYALRLKERAKQAGISGCVTWRGIEAEMGPVYNAMDINTLSSRFGEGFPNAVGEAMSCSVPCVVTDVGDSGIIVGDTGETVPPGSPEQLARGWTRVIDRLEADQGDLKRMTRQRIVDHFSVERYIDETEQLLLGLG